MGDWLALKSIGLTRILSKLAYNMTVTNILKWLSEKKNRNIFKRVTPMWLWGLDFSIEMGNLSMLNDSKKKRKAGELDGPFVGKVYLK